MDINNQIYNNIKKSFCYLFYVIIFMMFLWGFSNIPLIQDAWISNRMYNNSLDFVEWMISITRSTYKSLNGRIAASVIVGFFEREKYFLDIGNALVMSVIIFLGTKLFNKQRSCFSICILCLFLISVSVEMRTEVYFYAAMIYVFPVLLFLLQLTMIRKMIEHSEWFLNRKNFILFTIVSVMNVWWMENSSFAYVIVFGCFILWRRWKGKKWNIPLCIVECINVMAFAIMMCSPGLRSSRQFSSEISFKQLVLENMQECVLNVLMRHKLICFFLLVVCIILTVKRLQCGKRRYINIFYLSFLVFGVALFVVNILSEKIGMNIPSEINFKCGASVGVIVFLCVWVVSLPFNFSGNHSYVYYICYFMGIVSLIPIIVTPNFGVRICYFSTMMLGIITFGLYCDNILNGTSDKTQKIFQYIIIVCLCVRLDSYLIVIDNIRTIETERCEIMSQVKALQNCHKWNYEDTVVLPMQSSEQLYKGSNPQPFYFNGYYGLFLRYYGLNKDTLVVFSDYDDSILSNNITDGVISFTLKQNVKDENERMKFCIMKDGYVFCDSDWIMENNCKLNVPTEIGNYYFTCIVQDGNGGEKTIFSAKTLSVE